MQNWFYKSMLFAFPVMAMGIGVMIVAYSFWGGKTIYQTDQTLANQQVRDLRKYLNPQHLKYGKKNGIFPIENRQAFARKKDELLQNGRLTPVTSTRYVYVENFNNSVPYLTKEADQLLAEIGRRFRQRLEANGINGTYRLVLTSCLRTKQDQRDLRNKKDNVNAALRSAHWYGTTFDITYERLTRMPLLVENVVGAFTGKQRTSIVATRLLNCYTSNQKPLLGEVLLELQREGKCIALVESVPNCFHVTVR